MPKTGCVEGMGQRVNNMEQQEDSRVYRAEVNHNEWLEHWRPASSCSLRMFCLPHAGGSAGMYRGWQNVLPPGMEVCPVQYPGRGARFLQPADASLINLANRIFEGLIPLVDRPFVLLGHSMGALLAFELARRFEARTGP